MARMAEGGISLGRRASVPLNRWTSDAIMPWSTIALGNMSSMVPSKPLTGVQYIHTFNNHVKSLSCKLPPFLT